MPTSKPLFTTSNSANCPDCGSPVGDDWQLCPSCGFDLTPQGLSDVIGERESESIRPQHSSCPSCGRLIQLEWVACPHCRTRLRENQILHPASTSPSSLSANIQERAPRLPNTQIGLLAVVLVFLLTYIAEYFFTPSLTISIIGILVAAAGFGYWLYCVFQIHKVLQLNSQATYSIDPAKAVWFHLIPVYGIFWIFQWSNLLIEQLNQRREQKIRKGGMGLLLLLGSICIISGLSLSIQPTSASALLIAAFGLLLIQSVVDFFRAELSILFPGSDQSPARAKSAQAVRNFAEQNWFAIWLFGNLLVFIVILQRLPTMEGWSLLWVVLGVGSVQQMLLTLRKPEFVWWALSYLLGLLVGLFSFAAVADSLESAFGQNSVLIAIIGGIWVGFWIGLFQSMILRKLVDSGSRWWIAVCCCTGAALFAMILQDQLYVSYLMVILYIGGTGIFISRFLSKETGGKQQWPSLRGRQGIFSIALLITVSVFTFQAWQVRLLLETFVDVDATNSWQNTFIQLAPGNRVVIEYWTGTWSIDPVNPDDGQYTDANGVPGVSPQNYCDYCSAPDPAGTLGMLAARQGDSGTVFMMGNSSFFTALQNGTFSLMINDNLDQLEDNSGSITVRIQVYNR